MVRMMQTDLSDGALERPAGLPDYTDPPLVEVVIDLQFEAIPGLRLIDVADVWGLFRDRFPIVEEHPPVDPSFETFGPTKRPMVTLELVRSPHFPRSWFVSEDRDELIQFQPNRFIRNWTKNHDENLRYPRFERIIQNLEREFEQLSRFCKNRFDYTPEINQCEVRYVNQVQVDIKRGEQISDFFKAGTFVQGGIDDFRFSFRQTVPDKDGEPFARIGCDAGSARDRRDKSVLKFDIYYRGAPFGSNFSDARVFCSEARNHIVRLFSDITSDDAQKGWGRVK